MAENTVLLNTAAKNLKDYSEFKSDFMSKIDWKVSEWKAEEKYNTYQHFIVKNSVYWFKNLKEVTDKKALVLTWYANNRNSTITVKEILMEYKKQFGTAALKGYSVTRNKFFMSLYFDTIEQRNFIANNFCNVKDFFIITSDWFYDRKPLEFKIIWLPPVLDILQIQNTLSNYGEILELKREAMDLGDEDIIPSGDITGKFHIDKNTNLQDIPHIINFEGYNGLLIIFKRAPLCLTCSKTGHISSSCPTPFCSTCRVLKPKHHSCLDKSTQKLLYSQVMTLQLPDEDSLWNDKIAAKMGNMSDFQEQEEMQLEAIITDYTEPVEKQKSNFQINENKTIIYNKEVETTTQSTKMDPNMDIDNTSQKRPLDTDVSDIGLIASKPCNNKNVSNKRGTGMALRSKETVNTMDNNAKK